ncbi:MAG: hypothetical protein AUJ92_15275 [Armatimonadetes bacterium CG2_30_59_28]|nr:hypothetical protein [Armatimonadota bacterium]OIO91978.1 MAG: hypothetical protein AUJ92_15275 [Armatimonadetes bacterium CG2_30_59_28]PIU66696.1 MAG: hypothetical protein COS85_03745 [Armatimonadetes bacterium CG07_land_8_20_14_0_80_59_28]PIX39183.1 MAG: hypothetical protein COZ56_18350 [Armatimonadetes bacterium CG_4_8_14_3_um_filter_58_9]PIY41257.1 MAG: hypothetical protein COZ05_15985 [Armatimonadetes bacterium CG_4_10_14_3_um_filter_59_10]PJB75575.1 MAG: hypothetical protein CO095_036
MLELGKELENEQEASCFHLVYDSAPRYVNDHCFVTAKDGTFHLFHIVGPVGKGCYDEGSEITFGHASSRGLLTWIPHPDVLSVQPESLHEPHHIFAPFVVERNGVYHLFYAGINQQRQAESLCLATSRDLYSWVKFPANPIFRPSIHWAEYRPGSGVWACCRDPHILPHPEFGYIMYYVTWMKGTNANLVAIGAAVSDNLLSWQDAGPVMIREMAWEESTASMESPCVVARNGRYYLFYKHRNATRLVVSDDPLSFTKMRDIRFSIAHAAKVFEADEQWFISSCSRDLTDLWHDRSDRTRGLYLARLTWDDGLPELAPFCHLYRQGGSENG